MNAADIICALICLFLPLIFGLWFGYRSYENQVVAKLRQYYPMPPFLAGLMPLIIFGALAWYGIKSSVADGDYFTIAISILMLIAYPIGLIASISLYRRINRLNRE